jgi:hypothetical protein
LSRKGAWIKAIAAAWEMYVELVTRIAVVELRPQLGLLSEALSSLYTLFETTREILRKYGPAVAVPKGDGDVSFGRLAVAVLNGVLRPTLAKWHPLLLDWEAQRAAGVSAFEHERSWEAAGHLRRELEAVRDALTDYANLLAEVAGVQPLSWPDQPSTERGNESIGHTQWWGLSRPRIRPLPLLEFASARALERPPARVVESALWTFGLGGLDLCLRNQLSGEPGHRYAGGTGGIGGSLTADVN